MDSFSKEDDKQLTLSPEIAQLGIFESITLTASGGIMPYTFSITSGSGSIDPFTGVYTAPGTLGTDIIQVVDSSGSLAASSINIVSGSSSGPLTISPVSVSLNLSDSITLSASGGESPYIFTLITPISGSGESLAGSTYTAPSDNTGTASVRVTDNIGTSMDASINVSPSSALALFPSSISINLGSTIDFSASGGVPPYTYSLLTPAGGTGEILTSNIYTAPSDNTGTATVRVTDNVGTAYDAFVTVSASSALSLSPSAVILNLSGSISLSASGGVPPYTYSLLTPVGGTGETLISNTYTAPSDNTGTATVRVTDNIGSTSDAGITVTPSSALAVSPNSVSINLSEDIILSASGGVPPYFYSLLTPLGGTGENLTSNIYTAPSDTSGNAAVRVTDNTGAVADAVVTVLPPPDIDYIVTPSSISTVNNPAAGGSFISESFTITNNGADAGSSPVYWTAYISDDSLFDNPGDTPVDSGQISALAGGGGVSASVFIDSGSWPAVSSTASYYLFVDISSPDEIPANTANNNDSAVFSITVPDIDYEVISITSANNPADISTAVNETFVIQNTGADNGSSTVLWTAYISDDQILDTGTDSYLASGSISPLLSMQSSGNISLTGVNWPSVSGNYYILVKVSSSDETDTLNNYNSSSVFTINAPSDLDYIVTDISSNYQTVTTGSPVSEVFSLSNVGGLSGVSSITWEAFASSDTLWDVGDESIGTGSLTALAAGASYIDVPVSAVWTGTPGNYYLIVKVSAADETVTANNDSFSGVFTVNDPPDYVISSPVLPVIQEGGNLNELLSTAAGVHSFTITETAGFDGSQAVSWAAYFSSDASLDGSDTVFDSGSIPALSAWAASPAINIDGNLPGAFGYYYIILQLSAGDDSNPGNNSSTFSTISVWDNADIVSTTNIETDTDENDEYLSMAEDYAVLLNPGDTVNISGTIDIDSMEDLFIIRTGASETGLDVSLTWSSGADLDIYIYDDTGTSIGSSIDTSTVSEPAVLPWSITGLNPESVYYIGVYSYTSVPGQYELVITGK